MEKRRQMSFKISSLAVEDRASGKRLSALSFDAGGEKMSEKESSALGIRVSKKRRAKRQAAARRISSFSGKKRVARERKAAHAVRA